MDYFRGGWIAKTGFIGRVNVLYQFLLGPGETARPRLDAMMYMSPFRERGIVPVHARVDAFMQPLRWLWDEWPDYVKEGPSTTKAPPVHQVGVRGNIVTASDLGVGSSIVVANVHKWWHDAPLRCSGC